MCNPANDTNVSFDKCDYQHIAVMSVSNFRKHLRSMSDCRLPVQVIWTNSRPRHQGVISGIAEALLCKDLCALKVELKWYRLAQDSVDRGQLIASVCA